MHRVGTTAVEHVRGCDQLLEFHHTRLGDGLVLFLIREPDVGVGQVGPKRREFLFEFLCPKSAGVIYITKIVNDGGEDALERPKVERTG